MKSINTITWILFNIKRLINMKLQKNYRVMIPSELKPIKVSPLSECIEYVKTNLHNKEANKGAQFAYLHAIPADNVKHICPLFSSEKEAEEKRLMYLKLVLNSIERRYGKEVAETIKAGEQIGLTKKKKEISQAIANMYYCTLCFSKDKTVLVTNF